MLRSLGVPTRLVNGFGPGSFDSPTQTYIVRSEDAHTWRGTLDTLGAAAPPDALAEAPGTIVIGDVVSLADVIAVPSAADAAAEAAFEGGQHARRG